LAMLPARGLWIGTFHAMCARILRSEIEVLDAPEGSGKSGYTRDFTIYDTSDRNELLRKILKEANYDATRFKPSMVGAWISAWKNKGRADREEEDLLEGGGEGIEHE